MSQPQVKPRLARLVEAIEYTAFSRSSIYRAIKSGELKSLKLGGALRFEYTELDRWIDTKAQSEI